MSQIILGDVTTGIISLIPNITEEDIKKHTENENEKRKKKVRRAFTMPFRKRINKTNDDNNKSVINTKNDIILNETIIKGDCNNSKRIFRRSSFKKFITRIAQQITSVNLSVKQADTYRVPPFGGYVWPPDQTPGVTGLRNHGNTCFMNAVLQCLSHTDILAEYFVLDLYKADLKKRNKINSRKFGTKGELTEQLALVLKALWTCKYAPEHSTSFKAVVDRYGSQFRSSTQHDAQEFLFWLLDKVHEDLNTANKRKYKTVKNSYGRSDEVIAAETLANHIRCNNSFVQAVFQAQFRSSLSCPRCHKQSNTFDPFHCISVQLPQLGYQAVFVTVLYASQHPKQVKLGLGVPPGSPIVALREQLHADTSIIPTRLILAEINDTGFSRVFSDSHQMSSICETDPIYCIETPPESKDIRNLIICLLNVKRQINNNDDVKRFSTPFCIQVTRDISFIELQKFLLKEMSTILKPEVFSYTTPITEMFKIRLQDPSADPDTYLDKNVEHPLFTEMIDLALSIIPNDAGPSHIKLLLEWSEPEKFFIDMSDPSVEHESVSQLKEKFTDNSTLSLEQCLEHYTKAETLSTEDAWRCPHCQKYLPVVKTLGLWSLPDILVIHFKRFRQQQLKGLQAAKLTTMVKFPIHGFDMSPHLAKTTNTEITVDTPIDDNWSPWKKTRRKNSLQYQQKDSHYDLYAVCYHQGDTLETGHYTAACKNPYDHQWYKFDDQRISHVPEETVNDEIVNNEAYILFYQRRNLDTMDCSGTSSSSMDHWVSKIAATSIPSNSSSSIIEEKKSELELNETKPIVELVTETKVIKDIPIEVTQAIIESSKKEIINNEPEIIQTEILVDVCVEKIIEEKVLKEKVPEEKIEENKINIENLITIPPIAIEEIPIIIKEEILEKNETKLIGNCSSIDTDVPKDITKLTNGFDDHLETIKPIVQIKTIPLSDKTLLEQLKFKEDLSRKFSEMVSHHTRHIEANNTNRRSFTSATTNYRVKDCDTVAMIRGANSCSKDTLLFIDQQTHSLMEEDETLLSNRSHWISPVTPHKLITVSPKN